MRVAGSRMLEVEDPILGRSFRVWVLYPCIDAARASVTFGPYTVDVAPDGPIEDAVFPVVLVSHGSGSSPFLLRGLALHLAEHGFVVAAVEHPGNSRMDNALAESESNLVGRPRHLRLALDALVADDRIGPHVDPSRAAVVGHSLGAYTALASAGGTPWSRHGARIETQADPRVRALVLLAPAAFWYVPEGALASVTVPILIYAGEEDVMTPPWHAHLVRAQVPDKRRVTLHVVDHAGHYSFLSPLPSSVPSAADLPGFDRARVHERLASDVTTFLSSALA